MNRLLSPWRIVCVLMLAACPVHAGIFWDGGSEPQSHGFVVNDPDASRFVLNRDEHGVAEGLTIFDTTGSPSGVNTRLMLDGPVAAAELNRAKGWVVEIRYKPLARLHAAWGNQLTVGDDDGNVQLSFDPANQQVQLLNGHGKVASAHQVGGDGFIVIRLRRRPGGERIAVSVNGRHLADVEPLHGDGPRLHLGDAGTGGAGAGVFDYIAINSTVRADSSPPAVADDRPVEVLPEMDEQGWRRLILTDGQWRNVGGEWQSGAFIDLSSITPPQGGSIEHLTFRSDLSYSDFEAEFEFKIHNKFGSTGWVFRAADAKHYYLLHFPMIGQQQRAKHFWAAISKVDGDGWLQVLHMQMVPGVPSEVPHDGWHHARIVVKGSEIRAWVNGRPLAPVYDESFAAGAVGLESWRRMGQASEFRHLRIRGEATDVPAWQGIEAPPQPWFHPYPGGPNAWQHALMSMTRAPNGELLMLFAIGDTHGITRSKDNGRTWGQIEVLDAIRGDSVIHTTGYGRLIMQHVSDGELTLSESKDNGHTWTEWQQTPAGAWPSEVYKLQVWSPSPLVELDDGTLLRFVLGGRVDRVETNIYDWGSVHAMAFSMRSSDGGATWSSPISLDGSPGSGINFDLTEPVAAQLPNGDVVCYIRPIYSPFYWETRSTDRGKTWSPTVRGVFPNYASSLLCTKSGVLVYAGRFPGQGLHISHDSGMTWSSYRIDQTVWANGTLFEVEPDVVLYVYMTTGRLRGQFIRITADGAEPALDMLP